MQRGTFTSAIISNIWQSEDLFIAEGDRTASLDSDSRHSGSYFSPLITKQLKNHCQQTNVPFPKISILLYKAVIIEVPVYT